MRGVSEVAVELGCDWRTINGTVIACGTAMIGQPHLIGSVETVGLDETLFIGLGPLVHPNSADVDRGHAWSAAARHDPRKRRCWDGSVARCMRSCVAHWDQLGHPRPVEAWVSGVRHDTPSCGPGG